MRKAGFLIMVLIISSTALFAQKFRTIKNHAFRRGEKLEYKVYYHSVLTGDVTAGTGTLEVQADNRKFNNRNTMHIIGIGHSKGAFNWFYKVNDRFETYIDEEGLFPWMFINRTREGGYKKDDDITFHQDDGKAVSRNAVTRLPENVQDFLSGFYYARTLDVSKVAEGGSFTVPFFLNDTVYNSRIIYEGKDVITTELGTFNCLKFKPMVVKGDVFSDPYPMTIWVTDDRNRVPILFESAVIVGKVKMELIKYTGLANPFNAKVK
ncbi:MAG TPA: DUF3108 domain-containing protein [Bacteroidales bacterium]|jgi:Protein of unknown function (DUF3108)